MLQRRQVKQSKASDPGQLPTPTRHLRLLGGVSLFRFGVKLLHPRPPRGVDLTPWTSVSSSLKRRIIRFPSGVLVSITRD